MRMFIYRILILFILLSFYAQTNKLIAKGLPQYECSIEINTEQVLDRSDPFYIATCVINDPVDKQTLTILSQKVYADLYSHKYKDIVISWPLKLYSENELYTSDIGITYYRDGKLSQIYIPLVKKKEDIEEHRFIGRFLGRLYGIDAVERLKDEDSYRNLPFN